MQNFKTIFINGQWVDPADGPQAFAVVNPATETIAAEINLGSPYDVDWAVGAARRAFAGFAQMSRDDRLAIFDRIIAGLQARQDALAALVTMEMGAPLGFSRAVQVGGTIAHFQHTREVLATHSFGGQMIEDSLIIREPIGVVGMITPWNWPLNQIASKVAPALAAGCTMVVKPSEVAPLSAVLFTEILAEAGLPAGVFNLVQGTGAIVGEAISAHPDIDMVSFTGSTRAGIQVARTAAATVKRVHQELGGKSANIILQGCDLEAVIAPSTLRCFTNSGQSCIAPTRLLVHRDDLERVCEIAARTANAVVVGDPLAAGTTLGPLVSSAQYDRVQGFIKSGLDQGARLVAGGLGRPQGLTCGYYARPTVFADVTPQMTIAAEEIFGPVLSILTYEDEADAIRLANDSIYGLAAYVFAPDLDHARRVGAKMQAGRVYLNGATFGGASNNSAPFGGYKRSGNGRELGIYGIEDFMEIKALIGYAPAI